MARSAVETMHAEYGRLIDERIASWLCPTPERPDGFYVMMRYQLGLVDEDLSPVAPGEEKRLCPLLCLLTCQAVAGSCREAVSAAAAIELLWSWLCVHIDLEVHEPRHDGRKALWELWGDAQAINAGDGLFPLAGRQMLEAAGSPAMSLQLARELATTAVALMEGQHLELSPGRGQELTAGDRLRVIRLKRGALTGYSAWAGAVVGGAGEETRRALHTFGLELGTAWEILDEMPGPPCTSGREQRREPRVHLTAAHARLHLEGALAALERAGLATSGHQQVEAFARDLMRL